MSWELRGSWTSSRQYGRVELVVGQVVTPRLVLRPLRPEDLDDVHAMQSDPELVRYLPWELRTREQSRDWLRKRMAADRLASDDDAVAWAVQRRGDARAIGSVNAWWRSVEHRQGEVGFVFARSARGEGLASEAAAALVDLLFSELDLRRVCGVTDARNAPSAALMRRLGMRQEAHLRECERFKGEWRDLLVFAVLRHEWEGRRSSR